MFGCSNVVGARLKDNETIPYKLEEILQRPVINMGVQGSSIAYSVFNQIILAKMNICLKLLANKINHFNVSSS